MTDHRDPTCLATAAFTVAREAARPVGPAPHLVFLLSVSKVILSLCAFISQSQGDTAPLCRLCHSVWGFCFPGSCQPSGSPPRTRMHLQATLETCVGTISGHLTACRTVQPQIIYFLRIPVVTVSRDGRANPFSLSVCEEIPLAFLGPWSPEQVKFKT